MRATPERAFTIVELLIVIAVIGILITLITTIASRAQYNQKLSNTRATMSAVHLALDQFAAEDPLKLLYNSRTNKTFGSYPPYQVAGTIAAANTVANLLDWDRPPVSAGSGKGTQSGTLADRLARDLGMTSGSPADWVVMDTQPGEARADDDNRALSAYLTVFAPAAFNEIPQSALRPLVMVGTGAGEYVNTAGQAGIASASGASRQILGIHDAWGVPLDYFLHLRLEVGAGDKVRIVERVPVLRSRGIEREVYLARRAAKLPSDKRRWIFSREFPAPAAAVDPAGAFAIPAGSDKSAGNGWVRAVAAAGTGPTDREEYGYLPDQDP